MGTALVSVINFVILFYMIDRITSCRTIQLFQSILEKGLGLNTQKLSDFDIFYNKDNSKNQICFRNKNADY